MHFPVSGKEPSIWQIPTLFPTDTGTDAGDSPSMNLPTGLSELKRADAFTMMVMFQPQLPNSISVPIASVQWSWGFDVVSGDGGNTWNFASQNGKITPKPHHPPRPRPS